MGKFYKIIFIIFIITMLAFTAISYADVGSFDRYDSGGSYSSGSSYGGNSSFGDFGIIFLLVNNPVIAIILIIVFIAVIAYNRKNGRDINVNPYRGNVNRVYEPKINTQEVVDKIKQIDPNFSEEKFLSNAKEVYIKLQTAWTKKDWAAIRPFESNSLFEQHQRQLEEFVKNKRTNVMERISVKDAQILNFYEDGDREIIKMNLRVVQIDYVIDDITNQVIAGSKTEDRHMKYLMTFERKKGVKTKEGKDEIDTTNCPNCGAPTQVTSAGQCEYCSSIITTGEHGWVLTNLEGNRDYN